MDNFLGDLHALQQEFGLPAFWQMSDVIREIESNDPIFLLFPSQIRNCVQSVLRDFPGRILYAVKANPHPEIIKLMWQAGVRGFDVASLREARMLKELLPEADILMMHPIKSRESIRCAYGLGVRDFALDNEQELKKILQETSDADDLHLHLRVACNPPGAALPLAGKFGIDLADAGIMLHRLSECAHRVGITFHVGSQCLNPDAFAQTLAQVRSLIAQTGVRIDSIDVGGGFPVKYPGMTPPPFSEFVRVIMQSLKHKEFAGVELLAEPGRLMIAQGGATLARIELREKHRLFLNEGTYGSLFDAGVLDWRFPVEPLASDGRTLSENHAEFIAYGPTCDSLDKLKNPISLPQDISEGDWIAFGNLGAYGQTMSTRFNGFYSDTTVTVVTPFQSTPFAKIFNAEPVNLSETLNDKY